MKKIYLPFAIIFCLAIFYSSLNAQCPLGWQSESRNFTIPYDGTECNFTVYFCWMLDPLGIYHTLITGCYIEQECGTTIIQTFPNVFHEAELEAIRKWFADHYMLPPCNGGQGGPAYFTIMVTTSICVAIQNFGQTHSGMMIQCPNKDGICIAEYRVCAHYEFHPPKPDKYLVSYTSSGNSECPVSVPIPPAGYTFDDNWTSECFLQACP